MNSPDFLPSPATPRRKDRTRTKLQSLSREQPLKVSNSKVFGRGTHAAWHPLAQEEISFRKNDLLHCTVQFDGIVRDRGALWRHRVRNTDASCGPAVMVVKSQSHPHQFISCKENKFKMDSGHLLSRSRIVA